ncbi:MAG: DUF2798 domain-containing protein [Saccharospirillaceae bacterium]|nr:DUF2798 domain-containing protein [Saccharospirillaceae bacterium]MCD8531087.1 DUF2798 domain-containing protein [Saccharospirillaceae bacterium]
MQRFIFTLIFSFCLSLLMSGWVTFINLGIGSNFLSHWSVAFLNAWPAAFTIAYILSPSVQKLSATLTRRLSKDA